MRHRPARSVPNWRGWKMWQLTRVEKNLGLAGCRWRPVARGAHELELEAASGGEPLTSVESRELVRAVLGELTAEGGLEEGGRVGVGGKDPGEDDVGPALGGFRSDRPRVGV